MLIGEYDMNIYGEARKTPGRVIEIDFLAAKATRGGVSRPLSAAIAKYRKALPNLCANTALPSKPSKR